MSKISYPADVKTLLWKLYNTENLYKYLRTGAVLDAPISRVWKGKITKADDFEKIVMPWQQEWDNAYDVFSHFNFVIKRVIPVTSDNQKRYQYRMYTRIYIPNVADVFNYLGKTEELNKFLLYEKMLSGIQKELGEYFFCHKNFRKWIYSLSKNISYMSLKEEEHTALEWTEIILKGIIDRCKNRPVEMEYSRYVYLPFLHTKFLEQNIGMLRDIYNIVTGDVVTNKKELAEKMNISFGDPVFDVFINGDVLHLDTKQLNDRFQDIVIDSLLISENEKPIRFYSFKNIIVIGGVGWAIGQLFEKCPWIYNVKKIYYWGDCDMAGYGMLNMVKGFRNDIESILMDDLQNIHFARIFNDSKSTIIPETLINLNNKEMRACRYVKEEHMRCEQERIESVFVEEKIKEINSQII